MAKKKQNFAALLKNGPEEIKDARRSIIIEEAEEAQYEIVKGLRREVRSLEKNLLSLTDFYPDSELSLRVVAKNFNAVKLFQEVHVTKVALAEKVEEYEIALETYNTYFGELREERASDLGK